MVAIGGITRLTESGLSITEWKPITGIIPPLTQDEWNEEFERYKNFPEYTKLNSEMNVEEFKKIFFWEWIHRFLGRFVGIAFGVPLIYFIAKGKIRKALMPYFGGMFVLGGAQGALGWYMVQSGLQVGDDEWPRVSAYRLCAHLGLAFLLYLGLTWSSLSALRPTIQVETMDAFLKNQILKKPAKAFLVLTFMTAMSGAFVAGLDAGLVYNEFPYMGENFVPEEYWNLHPKWKNFFENSAAVQFNHRVLGITTFLAAHALWFYNRKFALPRSSKLAINSILFMSYLQATLGISTLLNHVPIPLAALHQSGSLVLLTLSTWFLQTLSRKPIFVNRKVQEAVVRPLKKSASSIRS